MEQDVTRLVNELFNGSNAFEDYQEVISTLNTRAESGDTQAAEILAGMAKKGFVTYNADTKTYNALTAENFEQSGFFDDVYNLVRSSLNKQDDEILALYREAGRREDSSKYTNANNLQSAAETIISSKNDDLDILHKAREELLKEDGDLSTALNAEEQERLLQLTGASSLAEVGLESVNTAAYKAAAALEALATAVP